MKPEKHPLCDICCLHLEGHDMTPEEQKNREERLNELKERVYGILSSDFNESEIAILDRRFGLTIAVLPPLEEVGVEFNISIEEIRRLEKKALEILAKQQDL